MNGPRHDVPLTRWERFKRWCNYWCLGPLHALRLVAREGRAYARNWFSREVFIVACERCGTIRKQHERHLPPDGELLCPVCEMRTFHVRIYYDHDDERHRELGRP